MTTRNGGDAEDRVDTRTPPKDEGKAPLLARYPVIAFSFNAEASRLVLLYRDPSTGQTVDQIPSEAALKQYEEAQNKEEKRKRLEVIVGGAAEGKGKEGGEPMPTGGAPPAPAVAASGHAVSSHRTDGATKPAAAIPAAGPAPASAPSPAMMGGGAARVNMVI